MSAGCSEFTRQGHSPVQPVIVSLEAASGARPDQMGGTLQSDVITFVRTPEPCSPTNPCATIFNDVGQVTMRIVLKDPGSPTGAASPSALNQVTFTRYRVTYRRADGQNVEGVDVPHAFDSAITFTVPNDGAATAGFQLVRHSAKREAPLGPLASSADKISTIAEVTFYGHDQAGNDVIVSGTIGIDFGDFGDPA
jgi:hypothetical protein